MEIDEAKDIALQVAEGLKEAHEKGIVHRDIKPANIMLTKKGQVKITDFGLAKLSWGVDLTKTSTHNGYCVAYMSPEQARGEEVDRRTDIWSLGVVLYEMLTGQLPFKGEQMQGMVYSILNKEPQAVASNRADVPGHIEQVIRRALEKEQTKRYQRAEELIQDLKDSSLSTFSKTKCSIIVLPFADMSPNKDNEYFSDGLTEELITDLSQIRSLCVISRNSAMALKGTRKNTKTIGRELNVQYVLEGSVRKAGNNLRITAQLINAREDVHLWADKYSGTLDDVFDIQEKVSRSIVDALKMKLSPHESKQISEHPIENIQAYECYLKAKHEILLFTEEGFERAIGYLQNGLRLLGENPLLLRGIGFARFQQLNIGASSDRKIIAEIEANAERILKWSPGSSHGYFLNGCVEVLKGDFREAVKQWRHAFIITPSDPDTMLFLGAHSLSTGQPEFARKLFDTLVKIDPLVPLNHMLISYSDFYRGKPADNLESLRRAVKNGSDNAILMWAAVRIFAAAGEIDEAFSVAKQLHKNHPATFFSQSVKAFTSAIQGNKKEVLSQLTDALYDIAQHDCEWATVLIECLAMSGENEKALNLLEHSVGGGLLNYPFLHEYDPFLENIRDEERFKKIMKRVKQEWENLKV